MADPVSFEPLKPIDMSGFFQDRKRVSRRRAVESAAPPFSDVLKDSVKRVNDLQIESDTMTKRLSLGEVEDISEVSIAVEKAELALRLMVQIRDKLVDAYQQVARMSV
ncbi:MAG: flagellar hook-basal body complex protein FliE [Synergistaceae bacterium]|jgi:flagellar hook-basal body complex protein FliE|nr:flagellar hook-basal body complex protein FliE [Synergistaceae bacterium]